MCRDAAVRYKLAKVNKLLWIFQESSALNPLKTLFTFLGGDWMSCWVHLLLRFHKSIIWFAWGWCLLNYSYTGSFLTKNIHVVTPALKMTKLSWLKSLQLNWFSLLTVTLALAAFSSLTLSSFNKTNKIKEFARWETLQYDAIIYNDINCCQHGIYYVVRALWNSFAQKCRYMHQLV